MSDHYKFELKPLKYSYDALEPYIDSRTVELHHNAHLKAYVDNLNKVLENYPNLHGWSLERLIKNVCSLPREIQVSVRNNAGGVYNHNLYFDIMTPDSEKDPIGELGAKIKSQFCSFENFKKEFKEAALSQFGSGYAWLVCDRCGNLKIVKTQNQDAPISMNLSPILLVDVWEHAYYLKYQNRRGDYIDNWFNVIDWKQANANYMSCVCK